MSYAVIDLPPLGGDIQEAPAPGGFRRFMLQLFLLSLAFVASVGGLIVSTVAASAETAARKLAFVTPSDMKSGALLFRGSEPGKYVEAPRVKADYDVTVSGPTIRTRVTQAFTNPTDGWVEGVYVYPLPEKSAVDTMKLVVGDRVIVADVKERQEAKRVYEEAKADGKTAALVEQERPNLFTNSVANIGPGETIVVQMEYQAPASQVEQRMSLRIPLVVAPRYMPTPVLQTVSMDDRGWGVTQAGSNDPVPDRDRISPPVTDPRKVAPTNPVTITVRLNAGFTLGDVASSTHRLKEQVLNDESRIVALDDAEVPADRDFELSWTPKSGPTPSVGLFRERIGGEDYVLGYVTPPAIEPQAEKRPREAIFVIDNSGSMSGPSMAQAKASLIFALDRLTPADRFDVIRFDDTMERLFMDTVEATPENVARAKDFVSRLSADGGTEMLAPLKAALFDPRPTDQRYLRQIVFLTDGAIGDEQRMFDAIGANRGRSRLFMVGIGSAPNSYLMTRAAELGRGTFTHIGGTEEVDARMRELFAKLESPVVTGLSAKFELGVADMTPKILPDLYRGEPLVFAAKVAEAKGALTLSGMIGDTPWSAKLDLARAAEGAGVSKLWARRKIDDVEVALTLRETKPEAADAAILKLALAHQLTTRLTSLVAVDRTPRRPAGEKLTRADVPLNLPAGWDFDKVFGEQPGSELAPPEMRKAEAEGLMKVAYQGVAQAKTPAQATRAVQAQAQLPQTATDAQLKTLAGLALILLALGLLAINPTRRRAA
ncbi:marine proteobacterial sortase target protein [Chelatococcus sambhunathii]|uniref:Marine proteobacterial sortase target protein n=1 Tax=Chelatococcus sambhunathii TaxID=363953 RepID=A0ABU1DLK9_9HYPH|nr:marine proteobacterial sortase target protein [Chelatococcus sambhunathii]MDR4308765.1 marine proteobacterial sortase target protein [Chelatococcus sambhunathii]